MTLSSHNPISTWYYRTSIVHALSNPNLSKFSAKMIVVTVNRDPMYAVLLALIIPITCTVLPIYMTPGFVLLGRAGCSYYFKSVHNSNWLGGKDDCRNSLGGNATLVHIGTEEQKQRIRQMLDDDYDGAATFWIDGGWGNVSGGRQCYKWFSTNQCVDEESVVLWDDGRPYGNTKKYLQIIYKGFSDPLLFRATKLHNNVRYLCQLPMKPEHCNNG